MPATRPTSDDLRFNSSANGESILDDYIEACELGGRSLPDLMNELFDVNGAFRSFIEMRENPAQAGQLQYRLGNYIDPEAGWITFSFSQLLDSQYLGASTTAPTVGNQGEALADGMLWFDTNPGVNRIKVYDLGTTSWLLTYAPITDQLFTNQNATITADYTFDGDNVYNGTATFGIPGTSVSQAKARFFTQITGDVTPAEIFAQSDGLFLSASTDTGHDKIKLGVGSATRAFVDFTSGFSLRPFQNDYGTLGETGTQFAAMYATALYQDNNKALDIGATAQTKSGNLLSSSQIGVSGLATDNAETLHLWDTFTKNNLKFFPTTGVGANQTLSGNQQMALTFSVNGGVDTGIFHIAGESATDSVGISFNNSAKIMEYRASASHNFVGPVSFNTLPLFGANDLLHSGAGQVIGTGSGVTPSSFADELMLSSSGHGGLTIATGDVNSGSIYFADNTLSAAGIISYNHANNSMTIGTSGSSAFTIAASHAVNFNSSVSAPSFTQNLNAVVDTGGGQSINDNLTVDANAGGGLYLETNTGVNFDLRFRENGVDIWNAGYDAANNALGWYHNTSTKYALYSDGSKVQVTDGTNLQDVLHTGGGQTINGDITLGGNLHRGNAATATGGSGTTVDYWFKICDITLANEHNECNLELDLYSVSHTASCTLKAFFRNMNGGSDATNTGAVIQNILEKNSVPVFSAGDVKIVQKGVAPTGGATSLTFELWTQVGSAFSNVTAQVKRSSISPGGTITWAGSNALTVTAPTSDFGLEFTALKGLRTLLGSPTHHTLTGATTLDGAASINGQTIITGSLATNLNVADVANNIIQSQGLNGYGAFYAKASGVNASYLFFGNAGGEKTRLTSFDDGSLQISVDAGVSPAARFEPGNTMTLDQVAYGNNVLTLEPVGVFGTNNPYLYIKNSSVGNYLIGLYDGTTDAGNLTIGSELIANKNLTLVGALLNNDTAGGLTLSGGQTSSLGGRITLTGDTHPTAPNEVQVTGTLLENGVPVAAPVEGTYAPVVTTGAGSVTVSATAGTLAYTLVGRICHVQGQIILSSVTTPTSTLSISLPYTAANLAQSADVLESVMSITNMNVANYSSDYTVITIGSNATSGYLYGRSRSTITPEQLADCMQTSTALYFDFTYTTNQ